MPVLLLLDGSTSQPPVAVLAHTGLDIATPIAIGLSILVVGILLVAWGVLRGSRTGGAHR